MRDTEITLSNNQSNKEMVVKGFYDLMYELSYHYEQFYEELSRNHPVIDVLILHGMVIRNKIIKIKEVYSELLKLKMLSFKLV